MLPIYTGFRTRPLTAPELAEIIVPIRVLCIGGIVAFVLVYWLSRQIESDIQALERVIRHEAPHELPHPIRRSRLLRRTTHGR